jgi:hypothetical protein
MAPAVNRIRITAGGAVSGGFNSHVQNFFNRSIIFLLINKNWVSAGMLSSCRAIYLLGEMSIPLFG